MSKKYAAEYRKRKRHEWARQIRGDKDQPLLDLLEKVRPYTHGAELGDDPRSRALRDLAAALDDVGEAMTGDPQYFWAKGHSIG